jgi:hypothetical protein
MGTTDIGGLRLPDSRIARAITDYVRDTESDLLFHHSARTYWWGVLAGTRLGLAFDPELLYAAAMFHDIGITPHYHGSALRFEVDGANAARDFLRGHGIAEADLDTVWLAIALHTTPGIPEHMHPAVRLVQAGAGMDMAGRGYDDYTAAEREAVLAAHPRGHDFAQAVIDTFHDGLRQRPQTTFGTFNDDFLAFKDPHFQRGNLCSILVDSIWER